jgi:hypothetical protein
MAVSKTPQLPVESALDRVGGRRMEVGLGKWMRNAASRFFNHE